MRLKYVTANALKGKDIFSLSQPKNVANVLKFDFIHMSHCVCTTIYAINIRAKNQTYRL